MSNISQRFREFLPVVVDVETGGFDVEKDALLEVAAVLLNYDQNGKLSPVETIYYPIKPFAGSTVDPESLKITKIDLYHPLRVAYSENQAAEGLFGKIREFQKSLACKRSILVGHNAHFDLGVINALAARTKYKHCPFHPFSVLDTVSLGALIYGQTVLSKIAEKAGIEYDKNKAHGAKYDAELTAEIFCRITNLWESKNGEQDVCSPTHYPA